MTDTPAKNAVFVCGLGRSGTTWIAQSLGQSDELVYIGEAWLLSRLRELVAWHDDISQNWGDFTVSRKAEIDPAAFRAHVAGFYEGLLLQASSGGRFVEKTPGWNIRHIDFLHSLFPEAYFILVYRDGRNQVASAEAHHARRDVPFDFAKACRRWAEAMDNITRHQRTEAEHKCTVVRYEDLLQDFQARFETLCRFVDVAPFIPPPRPANSAFAETGNAGTFNSRWHDWNAERVERFKNEAGEQLVSWDYIDALEDWQALTPT